MNNPEIVEGVMRALQVRDPTDEQEAIGAHASAEAMMVAAMIFVRARWGEQHLNQVVSTLVGMANKEVVDGIQQILEVGEFPNGIPLELPVPHQMQQPPMTLGEQIGAMLGYLRQRPVAEGQGEALAAIAAAATFLRERFGEGYAVGALRQIEAGTSQAAALDRWWPEGAAKH